MSPCGAHSTRPFIHTHIPIPRRWHRRRRTCFLHPSIRKELRIHPSRRHPPHHEHHTHTARHLTRCLAHQVSGLRNHRSITGPHQRRCHRAWQVLHSRTRRAPLIRQARTIPVGCPCRLPQRSRAKHFPLVPHWRPGRDCRESLQHRTRRPRMYRTTSMKPSNQRLWARHRSHLSSRA